MIRTFRENDLPAVHGIYTDSVVWRYMGIGPTTTIEETRERLERMLGYQRDHGFTFWAVTHAETGELLGDCGLIPLEGVGPEVELGYRFGSAHWGNGYATEAATACRDLGFDRYRLQRIYVDVHPENERSQNVARKLGARLLGPAKHRGFDVVRFVIDRPDGA
ncbi:MAG TPA: GNAT family N-acetyltransferase [Thermoleophilaceae bacterium]